MVLIGVSPGPCAVQTQVSIYKTSFMGSSSWELRVRIRAFDLPRAGCEHGLDFGVVLILNCGLVTTCIQNYMMAQGCCLIHVLFPQASS